LIKNITHFFTKIDAKHISSGVVKKLVANGYKDIISIVGMDPDKIAELDGFSTTLA